MHIRTLVLAAASLAALAPAVSTAAFASSLKGDGSTSVKLNYHSGAPSSQIAQHYTRDYTFFLKANDPKTGLPIARATCSATTAPIDAASVLAAKL